MEGRADWDEPHPEWISPLLCSCRRIYSEAIVVLYTRNIIHVRQTRTISEFPNVMLPHRLAMIRHLHPDTGMIYHGPKDTEALYHKPNDRRVRRWLLDVVDYWKTACLVIKDQMLGLKTLRVSFGARPLDDITDVILANLLRPLVAVRHVPNFLVEFHLEVSLDRVLEQLEVPLEDLPFIAECCIYLISSRSELKNL